MIEDEAKTKWCPFTRFHECGGRAYHNKPGRTNELDGTSADADSSLCIASKCMAWRWNSPCPGESPYAKGHCGLAGKS